MPRYAKRRTYNKKRGAPKKRMYKKRSSVSTTIKRYVKRTIHANIENKIAMKQETLKTVTAYIQNSNLLTLPMIPYNQIVQGLGQSDRISDVIKTRKCIFSFALRPQSYDAANNFIPIPQEVIIMFGKVKNAKPQQPTGTDFAKLFQFGNSNQAPQNRLLDSILPINSDYFTVYKKLVYKVGYSVNQGSGSNVASAYYANNEFKFNVVKKIDLTKFCPKTVKFNDTTAQPTNDGLWMWAFCNNADGTQNTFDAVPILMDYIIEYIYEDA